MRKRRKKSEIPFADALEFARKRLAKAQKELTVAQGQVASLSAEIPTLESAIDVLAKAIEPSKIGQPGLLHAALRAGEVKSFSGGSTMNGPFIYGEPTEDTLLPEPEGTELLPE